MAPRSDLDQLELPSSGRGDGALPGHRQLVSKTAPGTAMLTTHIGAFTISLILSSPATLVKRVRLLGSSGELS